ncbi:hypothetical protein TREPR_2348 [Treponema primitia ZAS-2]|uniref:Uncharacterized protein n=1 Tax=Treponema primitia (strain ATCC BAA-887 / DSM 12427 / ZAS-2) TaxID=545694 RepID=F5YHV9_TREPZ|nr:omptin family outer membrane protease [Treponema primitia]AEF84730.1 hypothetical protein TREPR_2348 [Treponema primitia ZAS-2]
MRSIYGFAFFVSICFISTFPTYLFAQNTASFSIGKTPYTFSLATGIGVLLGQAEEIVYQDDDDDAYLSKLLWDLKPMVYVGTALELSRTHPLDGLGAEVDLSVKFGLPLQSGVMEDRDWDDPLYPASHDDPLFTNFSSSDAYIQGAVLADFSGGLTIPVAQAVVIKALFSFSFMRFSWIARDGYRRYKAEDWEKIPGQGIMISYDQNWLIFSPGLGLSWPFHPLMGLDFNFFISPLIIAFDMDNHYLNIRSGKEYTQYVDTMPGGLYIEPSLDFRFSPTPIISLLLHSSWRYISGSRGDTTETVSGRNTPATVYENSAGAAYSAFDLALILKVALPLQKVRVGSN